MPVRSTLIGTRTLPNVALWTTGGGRIGMQLPGGGARVDDFAGGTVPVERCRSSAPAGRLTGGGALGTDQGPHR